ncbi:hypothetical protein IVB38_10105 [Bradyrhizobium sp. 38]|uniref:hypothetical protein n=1 Tax=unclassified Bradyrhizobium TaxID=2631580 RepID=UPI001FF7D84E|nr:MULTISPECIES: hypothetical protein [unclassified Bradyrhizobium]MCK1336376.1 hypothetical protein [Bradyrhizobium sp. 38]MCK1780872.1 hypothetical protein [Bradyrhizobium sp. 132]
MRTTILMILTAAMLAGTSVGAAFAQGGAGAGAGGAGAGAGAGGSASGGGGGGITHVERGGQGASSPPGMRNETTPPSNGTMPRR